VAKLSLTIVIILILNGIAIAATSVPLPTDSSGAVMTPSEMKYIELTNKERVSRGLSLLSVDPLLVQVGRQHSREMADKNYFSHTSPIQKLKTPMDRYLAAEKQRPSWALVGENLFYCSVVDIDRGHSAFMNREGHRDNILESRYERMGVGIYVTHKGEFYVTEMFLAKTT
jgi:uncharacterized protein YkwD